ncbi:unnamed protein product [Darwinula stevensoni]|uniref:Uncharacterized protein n=1 Tax=Darwinula stevensoni TaxID=69355 RepID=A0A7R9FTH7_9CRUS|nr:unnamed protein product [Darwinula stevensoni]CAG0906186.1 unnamed protein product [Darwinula stevensoni]
MIGPGLAFVAYPAALMEMPVAPLWSAIFFLMFIFVGLDSQFCTLEGFITALMDEWPRYLRSHKELFILAVSLFSFVIGLSLVSRCGMYVLYLMDNYAAAGMCLLFITGSECISIAWGYGASRFYANLKEMIGYPPLRYMKYCWLVFCPAVCFVSDRIDVSWNKATEELKRAEEKFPLFFHEGLKNSNLYGKATVLSYFARIVVLYS